MIFFLLTEMYGSYIHTHNEQNEKYPGSNAGIECFRREKQYYQEIDEEGEQNRKKRHCIRLCLWDFSQVFFSSLFM